MPFDTVLAERIRNSLQAFPGPIRNDMSEKRMFGGLAFLLRGKMTVGVIGKEMVVRIVGEKMEGILGMEGVRPMDFNKKPMKEFVFVSSEAMEHEEELSGWISLGIEHARRTLNL
ncbi:TfoX N-terminal domain-containing protein [Muriicola jejuensis]|uniref:TfoX N-terminal domain-containing protein n=2 Tax=Muriicola jejuensis TaxID=504488 RepID=A0A6P0UGJ2_9FLAO|nr:hypothetical protein [Muriicola jejuensis]SMP19641.1 TfoX N-terminal domain-containing protein [Muriicola jejuensis]